MYLVLSVHSDTKSANLQMQKIREIRMLSFSLITNAMHALLVTRHGFNCPAAQSLTLHLQPSTYRWQTFKKCPKIKNLWVYILSSQYLTYISGFVSHVNSYILSPRNKQEEILYVFLKINEWRAVDSALEISKQGTLNPASCSCLVPVLLLCLSLIYR